MTDTKMTDIKPNIIPNKAPPASSMNDNLPTTNPSLRTVLVVASCIALVALFLIFHKSLGF